LLLARLRPSTAVELDQRVKLASGSMARMIV
jgi:hypothetical protein